MIFFLCHTGVSTVVTGFIFSITEFAGGAGALVCGLAITDFGSREMYVVGLVAVGICSILFGLVEFISDTALFIACAFAIRAFEGLCKLVLIRA